MNFRAALNAAFDAFDIKACEISKTSGIGENQISNYKKGKKDLYAENLEKIIDSLPVEAKMYFYVILLTQIKNDCF